MLWNTLVVGKLSDSIFFSLFCHRGDARVLQAGGVYDSNVTLLYTCDLINHKIISTATINLIFKILCKARCILYLRWMEMETVSRKLTIKGLRNIIWSRWSCSPLWMTSSVGWQRMCMVIGYSWPLLHADKQLWLFCRSYFCGRHAYLHTYIPYL